MEDMEHLLDGFHSENDEISSPYVAEDFYKLGRFSRKLDYTCDESFLRSVLLFLYGSIIKNKEPISGFFIKEDEVVFNYLLVLVKKDGNAFRQVLQLSSLPAAFPFGCFNTFVGEALHSLDNAIIETRLSDDTDYLRHLESTGAIPKDKNNYNDRLWYLIKYSFEVGRGMDPREAKRAKHDEIQRRFFKLQ